VNEVARKETRRQKKQKKILTSTQALTEVLEVQKSKRPATMMMTARWRRKGLPSPLVL
jgi:hypothetical protein